MSINTQQDLAIESNVILPSHSGNIGIATNTLPSSLVRDSIDANTISQIGIIGPLITNTGSEIMMTNAISKNIRYLITFGSESCFCPASNLLKAHMYGIENDILQSITGGIGVSACYPRLKEIEKILEIWRENIIIIPLHKNTKNKHNDTIVREYIQMMSGRMNADIFAVLDNILNAKKINYEDINEIIKTIINTDDGKTKNKITLPSSIYKSLIVETTIINHNEEEKYIEDLPVWIDKIGDEVRINMIVDGTIYTHKGSNKQDMLYSISMYIRDNNLSLSLQKCMLIGSSLAEVFSKADDKSNTYKETINKDNNTIIQIPKVKYTSTSIDPEHYYEIGIIDDKINIKCQSHTNPDDKYQIRSGDVLDIISMVSRRNKECTRTKKYNHNISHMMYIGNELMTAYFAKEKKARYIQDFGILSENTKSLPYIKINGLDYMINYQKLIKYLYMEGLYDIHADTAKGMASTAISLVTFEFRKDIIHTLEVENRPAINEWKEQAVAKNKAYIKTAILSAECGDNTYRYGHRTRAYFGFDQLDGAASELQRYPDRVVVVQRFDPRADMSYDETNGWSHDPCMTHDIYWIKKNKLYALHTARAHNATGAYTENIYGLYAYEKYISEKLNIEIGNVSMLSSRINILLTNEQTFAENIIRKQIKTNKIDENTKSSTNNVVVSSHTMKDIWINIKNISICNHLLLEKLFDYDGVNIIEKAINYLKKRGGKHNNPILTTYLPKENEQTHSGMPFFQANVYGGKIYATAIFANRDIDTKEADEELAHYLAGLYARELDLPTSKILIVNI